MEMKNNETIEERINRLETQRGERLKQLASSDPVYAEIVGAISTLQWVSTPEEEAVDPVEN